MTATNSSRRLPASSAVDWATLVFSRPPDDQDSPILVDAERPDRTISWKQYANIVKSVATGLRQAGLKDQDCVALLSDNDIYYYVLGDAVVAAGGIFCALQTSEKTAELSHQLRAATVSRLFASPRFLDLAIETALDVGLCEADVIVYNPPGIDEYAGPRHSFSHLMRTDVKDWQNSNAGKDPHSLVAHRMFSSGTTGFPKAANISHGVHIARLHRLGVNLDHKASVNQLVFISIYHLTSLFACHRAILGQQTTYIASTKDTNDVPAIIDLTRKFRIHNMLLPPRFLTPFAETVHSGTRSIEDLASLEGVRIAGSAIDPRSAETFRQTFPNVAFRAAYGATELGNVVRMPGPHDYVPGYVGRLADDVEIKFIEPDTLKEVERGQNGEICVRTPQLFSGYNNNPEATRSAMLPDPSGDWFRTGDRGHINLETEQLALTGRYKEIFKVANNMVSPEEVERVLLCHPAIEDVAAGPTPARHDPNELEVRVYVVLKREAEAVSGHEIAKFVAERLSKCKVPTGGVVFCEEIPRNAMKKVIRGQIKDVVALEGSKEWISLEGS